MNVRIRPGGIVLFIAMVAALVYRLFYTLLWERPGDNGPLFFLFPKKAATVAPNVKPATPVPTADKATTVATVAPVVAAPTPTPIALPATAKPLNDWLVLAPISSGIALSASATVGDKSMAMEKQLNTAYLSNESNLQPHEGDVAQINNKPLTWRRTKEATVNISAVAENKIGQANTEQHNYSVAYAVAIVNTAKPMTNATLYLGSDDCVMVWLNGKLIHRNPATRGMELGQDKVKNLSLNAGANTLVFKVGNGDGEWKLAASLDAH